MNQPVAIVTGGGRGIGRATCVRLARAGYAVVAAARSTAELAETAILVEGGGGTCLNVACDLRRSDDVNRLTQTTLDRFGLIDVLVNAAGVAPLAYVEQMTSQAFDDLNAVNIKAVFETCHRVWPVMRKQSRGVIVNISSVASVDPFPGFAAYGASKAWVNLWSKALAEEGRPHGIRVFSVAPGAVETQMLRGAFPDFPADQCLQPEDVAELIHELTKLASPYSSGETLFIRREDRQTMIQRSVA